MKYITAVIVLLALTSPALADEKTRTAICATLDLTSGGSQFPIEFTKEWYEHDCKIIYAEHGGYAPGAREPRRKVQQRKRRPAKEVELYPLPRHLRHLPPCGIRECE
jgi:N-glycosylase/DNA lyase